MPSLRHAIRYVRSLSKGIARGDLFPPDGRTAGAEAPGGTTRPTRTGGPLRRVLREALWFDEAVHQVAIPGLDAPLDVLHLTDIHLARLAPWVDQLRDALTAVRPPDLLVITGDLVTRGWTPATVDRLLSALPDARLGRYAILGNWEHWSGATGDSWRRLLAEHRVQLLVNEAVELGPLRLVGTDDHLAGEANVAHLLASDGPPTVVLTHSPAYFPQVVHPSVALVLAGHSHAGQWRLPGLGVPWVPKGTGAYVAGWYHQETTWLHVSPGLGWSIAPIRLWCPPELSRIRLLPG
jgi:predicted MPP superfamily phosphohydrolase